MKKTVLLLTLMLISISNIQCSKQATEPAEKQEKVFSPAEKTIARTSQSFGLKLFAQIQEDEKDKNIFISPYSVSMALGMTLNGAKNGTYTAMQKTLELEGITSDEINSAYKSLMDYLISSDKSVKFKAANSIWYRKEFSVLESFLDVNRNFFNSSVNPLNFDDPLTVNIINKWVSDNTEGKIDKIIDSVNPDAMMYLINAIYFKGMWKTAFPQDKSYDGIFVQQNGSQKTARMMKAEGTFRYQKNDSFEAVELPYGDGNFVMDVFLPAAGSGTDELIKSMNYANWNSWMKNFTEKEGTLDLPKFKMEYELTMNDVLSSLGMQVAFNSSEADFTGINPYGHLFIGLVKHKTYVAVDEQGTEAAAVTIVDIRATAVNPDDIFLMIVNRPFVFVIREKNSDTILFMGKIVSL